LEDTPNEDFDNDPNENQVVHDLAVSEDDKEVPAALEASQKPAAVDTYSKAGQDDDDDTKRKRSSDNEDHSATTAGSVDRRRWSRTEDDVDALNNFLVFTDQTSLPDCVKPGIGDGVIITFAGQSELGVIYSWKMNNLYSLKCEKMGVHMEDGSLERQQKQSKNQAKIQKCIQECISSGHGIWVVQFLWGLEERQILMNSKEAKEAHASFNVSPESNKALFEATFKRMTILPMVSDGKDLPVQEANDEAADPQTAENLKKRKKADGAVHGIRVSARLNKKFHKQRAAGAAKDSSP
jgi:hypothetical protein